MNDKHKDEFSGADDKFSELGQQAGALLGQLFSAAEQFGQQVSRESQAWSESQPSREPFVSALRQASEEFRATANRAAESVSDSFRNSPGSVDETAAESANPMSDNPVSGNDIKPGTVHKIGGAATESVEHSSEYGVSDSLAESEEPLADSVAAHRADRLAEIFRADRGLSNLTANEFDALKTLLEKNYRSIRDFQNHK